MTRLTISLLGSPKVAIDGVPLKITTKRAIPLLAYLAITESSCSREALAGLFWSDSHLPQALASLRTTLWRLKSLGLDEWLIVQGDEISLNHQKPIEVDVLNFIAKINKCNTHGHPLSQICIFCIRALTEAIDLYHGEFLSRTYLSNADGFEDWRTQQSEHLHILFLNAIERLVKGHRTFGDFSLAIQYARILLQHDHLNESAQYNLLQLYSITGQRAAAINQYKRYKNELFRELNILPSEEITSLYKEILTGRSSQQSSQRIATPVFLIADIEKAAQFWPQDNNERSEIIDEFQNVFVESAKKFGGNILQKSEENITILFTKGQPLHCTVTIHQKIKKINWGVNGPPGVRMVLYSTEAVDGNENSFSSIARTASALLSISWGGQVIFSEQTFRVLDQPPGSKVKDLGFHALKNIREPVHIYELVHPNLPNIEHQPLRSGSYQSINFPNFSPAFIGREAELAELTKLIDSPDTRIVSLIGPGGVGKTRLAAQFAIKASQRFPDGVYFISLASTQDPEMIPVALANALSFTFYGPQDYKEQICNYLHRMHALLVFDNFEQVRLEGSKFLSYLLTQTHNLKILVTTRERINLLAETSFEVHGLPIPSSEQVPGAESYGAIKLFLQNSLRILPKFNYESNAAAIVRICQLVNGLPLGIILASSWIRVYSCTQIAEEIENNINFLESTALDIPPRHRSLRAVFDNSWSLLSEEERLILARLSIFTSTLSPQAAQEICSASALMLSSFQDKSLLSMKDNRYEMLETFHLYALNKLISMGDEYSDCKEKYIQYFANFCVQNNLQISTSSQKLAIQAFNTEFTHISTAWGWMIDLNRWDLIEKLKQPLLAYFSMTGNFIQGRELFRLAMNKLENYKDPSLLHVYAAIQQTDAWMTVRNGFVNDGLVGLRRCLITFRHLNAMWDVALTLMFLADGNRMLGNYRLGQKYIEEALEIIKTSGFPDTNEIQAIGAHCQFIYGTILGEIGDYALAEANLNKCLETHNRLGTRWGSIHPLLGLGKLAYMKGEFIASRDLYLQALETATEIYDQRGMAMIHNNLSATYEECASPKASYDHLLIAQKLCKETGDRRLNAVILNNIAYHQWRFINHPSDAIRTYHESIEIFYQLGDVRGITYTYYDISKAYLQVGLIKEAKEYSLRAMQSALTMDDFPMVIHALHGFINYYEHTSQKEHALGLCYLLNNHPQVRPDTQKRVIVSLIELEASFPPEVVESAQLWAKSANLQEVIDQILQE